MTTIKYLTEDNIRYIEQAISLLESMDDARYSAPAPLALGSPVGAHLRHCIDHYDSFLAGVASGRIDYDARQREPLIERSRTTALARLRTLSEALSELSNREDTPLGVKMDCGGAESEDAWWTDSSIRRELQFLISHTVHHYAIIKMTLIAGGMQVGADFGLAPSTLRYHQGASACAH